MSVRQDVFELEDSCVDLVGVVICEDCADLVKDRLAKHDAVALPVGGAFWHFDLHARHLDVNRVQLSRATKEVLLRR
jgi:hypothetical protein